MSLNLVLVGRHLKMFTNSGLVHFNIYSHTKIWSLFVDPKFYRKYSYTFPEEKAWVLVSEAEISSLLYTSEQN